MVSMTIELRNVEGTEAAMGWAGGHTIVVDRPEGKAGGRGLGFNGAELLALAIGGCFCNDLRYVAAEMGVRLGKIAVSVTVDLEGDPLIDGRDHGRGLRNHRRLRSSEGRGASQDNLHGEQFSATRLSGDDSNSRLALCRLTRSRVLETGPKRRSRGK